MKKWTKILALPIMILAFSIVFAACGGKGKDNTDTDADTDTPAEPIPSVPFGEAVDAAVMAMAGVNVEHGTTAGMTVDGAAVTLTPDFESALGEMDGTMVEKTRFGADGKINGYYAYSGDDDFRVWDSENEKMYTADGSGYSRYDLPAAKLGMYAGMDDKGEWMDDTGSYFLTGQDVTAVAGGYKFKIDMSDMLDTDKEAMGSGTATVRGGKITRIVISAEIPTVYTVTEFAEEFGESAADLIAALKEMGAGDNTDEDSEVQIIIASDSTVEFLFTDSLITEPVPTLPDGEEWTDRYKVTVKNLETDEVVDILYGNNGVSAYLLSDIELFIGTVCDGIYMDKDKNTPIDDNVGESISGDTVIYADIRELDTVHTALLTILDKLENDTNFEVYSYEDITESENITVLKYAINKWGDSYLANGYQKFENGTQAWVQRDANTKRSYRHYIDGNGVYVSGSRIYVDEDFSTRVFNTLPGYIGHADATVTETEGVYTVVWGDDTITVSTADNAITEINLANTDGAETETVWQYFINGGESKLVALPDNAEWKPECNIVAVFVDGINEVGTGPGASCAYITMDTFTGYTFADSYDIDGFYYDKAMTDALTADTDGLYFLDPAKADEDGEITVYIKVTPKV